MRDAGELLHPVVVQTSVNTTAAATGDDDASQCDVIGTHPELHLLLTIMGSATKFVFYHHYF